MKKWPGVESVTVAGRDRDLLLVIGDGVDESKLTKKLRREVGEAEILELRTLDAGGSRGGGGAASLQLMTAAGARNGKGGGAVVFAQSSPYHGWHGHPPLPGGACPVGRIMYPVTTTTTATAASPGARGGRAASSTGRPRRRRRSITPATPERVLLRRPGRARRPRRGAKPPGELLADGGAARPRRRWPWRAAPEGRETAQLLLDLVALLIIFFCSLSFFSSRISAAVKCGVLIWFRRFGLTKVYQILGLISSLKEKD